MFLLSCLWEEVINEFIYPTMKFLLLLLLSPIVLLSQEGNYELSLTPYIKTNWHEGAGIGIEYFLKEKTSVGLFLSTGFSKLDESPFNTYRYDTYRLAVRINNYFQVFKKSKVKHYLGMYLDGGLSRASFKTVNNLKGARSTPDASIGLMVGIFKVAIKKFSIKADYASGFRFYKMPPSDLKDDSRATRIIFTRENHWSPTSFYRFSFSLNYQL